MHIIYLLFSTLFPGSHYLIFVTMSHSAFITFNLLSICLYLPFDVLSHSAFITFDHLSFRHYLPIDVLSFQCFFTILHFFHGPFVPFDVLSVDVLFNVGVFYFDILSVNLINSILSQTCGPCRLFQAPGEVGKNGFTLCPGSDQQKTAIFEYY